MSETEEPKQKRKQEREFPAELTDFLNEKADLEAGYKVSCFSVERTNGRDRRSYLGQYDEIPDYSEIGDRWGPGLYLLNLSYTDHDGDRKHTSMQVRISEKYQPTGGYQAPQQQMGSENTEMSMLYQMMLNQQQQATAAAQAQANAMMGLVQTCIQSMAQMSNAKTDLDMGEISRSFTKGYMESMREMQSLVIDATRSSLEIEQQPEPEEEPTVVQQIFQLLNMAWENWGEKLLNAPKAEQQKAAQMVQAMPDFQMIRENPQAYGQAYLSLIENGAPKEDIDRLLGIIGAPIPKAAA